MTSFCEKIVVPKVWTVDLTFRGDFNRVIFLSVKFSNILIVYTTA